MDRLNLLVEIRTERYFSYFIAFTFFLGVVSASLTDTWYTALGVGGSCVIIFLLLRQLKIKNSVVYHSITILLLVIQGSQLAYQYKYISESFFIFLLIVMSPVFLKDWRQVLWAALLVIIHQAAGYFFLSSLGFAQAHFLFYILLAIAVMLAGYVAYVLKKLEIANVAVYSNYTNEIDHKEKNISFAKEISSGNFNASYVISDDNVLGHSLIQMSKNLKRAAEEERNRTWAVEGIAQVGEILRQNHDNIEDLANKVIAHLVKYVNASQGGMFVFNNENPQEPYLELKGCYAYNRRKYLDKRVEMGQGLLGQACVEKEAVFLTEVPQDYLSITSGLGEANPDCILIVPLKIEEEIVGAIEIASFEKFKEHERQFLEKVTESIASSVINSKVNDRTSVLLKDSQVLTEQLRAQEEEMRQNMEELQATQEDLQRKNEEQKTMQEELAYEKFLFHALMDNLPDRIHFKDEKGKFLRVNKAKALRHGIENASDIIGKSDFDYFDKESAQQAYDEELEIMRTGIPILGLEKKLGFNDGQEAWGSITKMPLYDKDGKVIGTFGITSDITSRKKVETELRKETYLLNALMTHSTDYIYFKDRESKFIRVSQTMANIFGATTPDDLTGKSDFDFFTKEHALPAFNDEQQIIQTGKPILDLIEKETWEDGRESWVSTTKMPLIDADGNIVGTFGISRNITKEKKAQEMIIRNERRYRSMMEYSKDISFLLNNELEIYFLSPSLNKNLGYEPEDVLGNYLLDILHHDDHEAIKGTIRNYNSKDETVKIECRLKNKLKKWEKVDMFIHPLIEAGVSKGLVINSYIKQK